MISIRMLKMWGESIRKALEYIFRVSLNDERFSSEWKKANVVPIHKKMINKSWKIIGWYHYFQSAPKSLKE